MKITQKARVALGEHQSDGMGMGNDGKEFKTIHCQCGWGAQFYYKDLPDGESNATPYLNGLIAGHQIEEMENV